MRAACPGLTTRGSVISKRSALRRSFHPCFLHSVIGLLIRVTMLDVEYRSVFLQMTQRFFQRGVRGSRVWPADETAQHLVGGGLHVDREVTFHAARKFAVFMTQNSLVGTDLFIVRIETSAARSGVWAGLSPLASWSRLCHEGGDCLHRWRVHASQPSQNIRVPFAIWTFRHVSYRLDDHIQNGYSSRRGARYPDQINSPASTSCGSRQKWSGVGQETKDEQPERAVE